MESATSAAPGRQALVVGAAGALGSALLEKALGCGGFSRVGALVARPLEPALRGLVALPFDGFERRPAFAADTAWIVFDRERAANGREAPFYRPDPGQLTALARWLHDGGVRRLLVVLPHAPGLLPQALRQGLASLDEQAVSLLGFEQLVFVRPAQVAAAATAAAWPHRVARAMLSQLHWMIPQREQPVRAERVAAFAVQLGVALATAPPGTRVAPPELLWQAAVSDDLPTLARQWLRAPQAASP